MWGVVSISVDPLWRIVFPGFVLKFQDLFGARAGAQDSGYVGVSKFRHMIVAEAILRVRFRVGG